MLIKINFKLVRVEKSFMYNLFIQLKIKKYLLNLQKYNVKDFYKIINVNQYKAQRSNSQGSCY